MSEQLTDMVAELQHDFRVLTDALTSGAAINDDLLNTLQSEEGVLLGMALQGTVNDGSES